MKNTDQGQPSAPQYQSGKRNNFTGIASNPNGNAMSSTQQIRGAPPAAQATGGNMAGATGGNMVKPMRTVSSSWQGASGDSSPQPQPMAQAVGQVYYPNAAPAKLPPRQLPMGGGAKGNIMDQMSQNPAQAGGLQQQQQQAQAIRQQPNATNRGSQKDVAMEKSMWEKALNTPEGKEQITKSMAGSRGQAPINY